MNWVAQCPKCRTKVEIPVDEAKSMPSCGECGRKVIVIPPPRIPPRRERSRPERPEIPEPPKEPRVRPEPRRDHPLMRAQERSHQSRGLKKLLQKPPKSPKSPKK